MKFNLTLIGLVVSETKIFKECGRRTATTTDDMRRRSTYLINSPVSLRLRLANKQTHKKKKMDDAMEKAT